MIHCRNFLSFLREEPREPTMKTKNTEIATLHTDLHLRKKTLWVNGNLTIP